MYSACFVISSSIGENRNQYKQTGKIFFTVQNTANNMAKLFRK